MIFRSWGIIIERLATLSQRGKILKFSLSLFFFLRKMKFFSAQELSWGGIRSCRRSKSNSNNNSRRGTKRGRKGKTQVCTQFKEGQRERVVVMVLCRSSQQRQKRRSSERDRGGERQIGINKKRDALSAAFRFALESSESKEDLMNERESGRRDRERGGSIYLFMWALN